MTATMNLNRETALRIALAARAMPGISVGRLLEVLHDKVPGELTETSLQSVTVTDIKTGLANVDGEEEGDELGIQLPGIKDAVRILWGEADSEHLPVAVPLDVMPAHSIRVAIASNNGEQLDGHFGSCLRFLIYQVNADSCQLVAVRSTLDAEFAEDRNSWRTGLIKDCQVLYVVSIGGPAAAKVIKSGLYPIKKNQGAAAADVLAQLQQVMRQSPPPWLAKLLGASAEQRVRFERSEEAI